MSNQALTWAFAQSTGNAGRKAVLVALADKADERHSCYPKQDTLARMTDQSERAVRGHLAWLEEHGLIRRDRQYADGRRRADRYVLAVSVAVGLTRPVPADPAADLPADSAVVADPAGTVPADPAEPTGRSCRALTLNEPSTDLRSVRAAADKPKSSASKRGTRLPEDWRRAPGDVTWQAEQGIPDEFARAETAAFRDYWKAKPGAGGCKLDWSATWRNWMRRAWGGREGDQYRRRTGTATPLPDFETQRLQARQERARAAFAAHDPLASAR